MKSHYVSICFAALAVLLASACTSESTAPPDGGGVDVTVDTSLDMGTTASCPVTEPSGTSSSGPISCSAPPTLVCNYVRVHCPGHYLGEFYEYERAMYKCEAGTWRYTGQDCYDCCRGFPFDGGSDAPAQSDGGIDANAD